MTISSAMKSPRTRSDTDCDSKPGVRTPAPQAVQGRVDRLPRREKFLRHYPLRFIITAHDAIPQSFSQWTCDLTAEWCHKVNPK